MSLPLSIDSGLDLSSDYKVKEDEINSVRYLDVNFRPWLCCYLDIANSVGEDVDYLSQIELYKGWSLISGDYFILGNIFVRQSLVIS